MASNSSGDKEPLIIDLGKQRKKRIKQLRLGKGRLIDDVARTVEELRRGGHVSDSVQPVVVVVRERPPRRRRQW